eukprot:m.307030 g.307030  ORF g.307030 m.307030 type:complete len:310 (-) comp15931_c0_seq1:225-1154(-)
MYAYSAGAPMPQHFLYLRVLPHGHGSLRPTFAPSRFLFGTTNPICFARIFMFRSWRASKASFSRLVVGNPFGRRITFSFINLPLTKCNLNCERSSLRSAYSSCIWVYPVSITLSLSPKANLRLWQPAQMMLPKCALWGNERSSPVDISSCIVPILTLKLAVMSVHLYISTVCVTIFPLNSKVTFEQPWTNTFVQIDSTANVQSLQFAKISVERGSKAPGANVWFSPVRFENTFESLDFAAPNIACIFLTSCASMSPSTAISAFVVATLTGFAASTSSVVRALLPSLPRTRDVLPAGAALPSSSAIRCVT